MTTLLQDLTSKDPRRIWSASCALRTLQDLQQLSILLSHLEEVRQSTQGVPLGVALPPLQSS